MENETPFGMGKTGRVDVITRIGAAVGDWKWQQRWRLTAVDRYLAYSLWYIIVVVMNIKIMLNNI
jgi:hypothetical protein